MRRLPSLLRAQLATHIPSDTATGELAALDKKLDELSLAMTQFREHVDLRLNWIYEQLTEHHGHSWNAADQRHKALDELIRMLHGDSWHLIEGLGRAVTQIQREIEIDYESTVEALAHVSRALRELHSERSPSRNVVPSEVLELESN